MATDPASISDALLTPLQADMKAIYVYVNSSLPRAIAAKNAKAVALIQNFQGWFQNLGPLDHLFDQDTLSEAKRRRNDINTALGEVLPPDWIPADNPQQPPDQNAWVADLKKGAEEAGKLPAELVTLLKVVAALAGGVLLWNLYQGTKKNEHEHEEPEEDVEVRAHEGRK